MKYSVRIGHEFAIPHEGTLIYLKLRTHCWARSALEARIFFNSPDEPKT